MEKITLGGKQNFMGKEIPIVYGGFGEGKKCVSDKTVSEIHKITTSDIRKAINRSIVRFKEYVDFIDMKRSSRNDDLISSLGYSKQQVIQAEHIYILSERGYAKLIKIMDTDLAWEVHDKLIDEYFQMREEKEIKFNELSPMLRTLINLELRQKEQESKINAIGEKVESIKDVVALSPNNWRKETANLINKAA